MPRSRSESGNRHPKGESELFAHGRLRLHRMAKSEDNLAILRIELIGTEAGPKIESVEQLHHSGSMAREGLEGQATDNLDFCGSFFADDRASHRHSVMFDGEAGACGVTGGKDLDFVALAEAEESLEELGLVHEEKLT